MSISASREKLVTVFGGSGFVGRQVVKALAKRGYRVRVAVRRPDLAGHCRTLGNVGQVQPIQANLRYPQSVAKALEGADAAVNLVGILYQSGRQKFNSVQEQGPRAIAEACKAAGISNLVHMSAIGANEESDSLYAQSKAAGEKAVLETIPSAIIMRPSIVFGPEDNFFNQFGDLATKLPFLPMIGGGETKFQPVYVGDVAEAVAKAIDGELEAGATYELGGPEVASFKECLEKLKEITYRSTPLVPLPFAIAKLQARFLQLLPKPLLTVDQVTLLKSDNIVSEEAKDEKRTLAGMGINPQSMDAILPTYMVRFRPYGQYAENNA